MNRKQESTNEGGEERLTWNVEAGKGTGALTYWKGCILSISTVNIIK